MKKTPTGWSAFFSCSVGSRCRGRDVFFASVGSVPPGRDVLFASVGSVSRGRDVLFASVGRVSRGRDVIFRVRRACFPITRSDMVERDRSYLRALRAPENDEFFGRSFVARPRFGEGEDKSLKAFFEFAAHVTLVRRFAQRERQQRQARVVAYGGHLVVPQFALLALVGRVVQLDDQQRLERQ